MKPLLHVRTLLKPLLNVRTLLKPLLNVRSLLKHLMHCKDPIETPCCMVRTFMVGASRAHSSTLSVACTPPAARTDAWLLALPVARLFSVHVAFSTTMRSCSRCTHRGEMLPRPVCRYRF